MGFEGGSSRRKRIDGRITKGGVEFTHNALTDQVTCTMCGQYGAASDLAYMLDHAATHRPAEVARVRALAHVHAALERLDAAQLAAVDAVLPAIVANPDGFTVVARALTSGECKHPGRGLGPSPDQSLYQHLAALGRHAAATCNPLTRQPALHLRIDTDTGLPHAGLAAARGVLAIQRAAGNVLKAEDES